MALQLPESESSTSNRLTGKFPSTTTLWQLLRHFESEPANLQPRRNFTARGIPEVEKGSSGFGGFFYETPVIQLMGRELASFTDLQKSLAQLGLNNGSALLRLNFRRTDSPLEEAIAEIDEYFKITEGQLSADTSSASAAKAELGPSVSEQFPAPKDDERSSLLEPSSSSQIPSPPRQSAAQSSSQSAQSDKDQARHGPHASPSDALSTINQPIPGPAERPISVFAPSSASTPAASRQAFNEKDYEPTIAHAKMHQARLATSSVNKRLPTDAELAVQAESQAKRNADAKEVEVKVRFPDQMQVVSTFSTLDTSTTLYDFVKGLLEKENEPFTINFRSAQGPKNVPKMEIVRLIDLGMAGRVLINVVWEAGVSNEAREGSVLKAKFQDKATQIEVKEVESVEMEKPNDAVERKGDQKNEERGRKGGVPKWLKLPVKR